MFLLLWFFLYVVACLGFTFFCSIFCVFLVFILKTNTGCSWHYFCASIHVMCLDLNVCFISFSSFRMRLLVSDQKRGRKGGREAGREEGGDSEGGGIGGCLLIVFFLLF